MVPYTNEVNQVNLNMSFLDSMPMRLAGAPCMSQKGGSSMAWERTDIFDA